MKYYLAPMEGITGYIYRNVYNDMFGNIDKYYTPFITTNEKGKLSSRELNEILPEHNKGMNVIPQILSNNADDFIKMTKRLSEYGYKEVNLNLGCPSGTVVSKKRGAGLLSDLGLLDCFLCEIYEKAEIDISVKTRIGISDESEFENILAVFEKYPISELIIHPRVREDYYKNKPHMDAFKLAYENSKTKLVYNGDIFNKINNEKLTEEFPDINAIMLGRGVIGNPSLIRRIRKDIVPQKSEIKEFHDRVYNGYQEIFSGNKNALFKMKEIWFYMIHIFEDSEKAYKKIKKAQNAWDYEIAVREIFDNLKLNDELGFR